MQPLVQEGPTSGEVPQKGVLLSEVATKSYCVKRKKLGDSGVGALVEGYLNLLSYSHFESQLSLKENSANEARTGIATEASLPKPTFSEGE